MSQKRKHGEATGDAAEPRHFSKKPRGNTQHNSKFQKRPHKSNSRSTNDSQTSNQYLKNRIRDLRRLLDHADQDPSSRLPANVRIDRERELEACEHELAEKRAAAKEAEFRNKIIGKYHRVRFFERQKATRILKQRQRELNSLENPSPEQKEELERKVHNAQVDLNYTLYYPLLKPYVALFIGSKRGNTQSEEPGSEGADGTGNKTADQEDAANRGNPDIWVDVEKAMGQGVAALDALRNWKPERSVDEVEKKKEDKKKKGREDRRNAAAARSVAQEKSAAGEEEGEDSDGGFFE